MAAAGTLERRGEGRQCHDSRVVHMKEHLWLVALTAVATPPAFGQDKASIERGISRRPIPRVAWSFPDRDLPPSLIDVSDLSRANQTFMSSRRLANRKDYAVPIGSRTTTVVPPDGGQSMAIWPLCASMRRFAVGKPEAGSHATWS